MTSNDWQNRLLTDEELQNTLARMGALEGIQVLQRQLELRSTAHQPSEALRGEVSNQIELGLTDVVPMVLDNEGIHPVGDSVEVAETSDQDIAAKLNALFANRAPAQPTPAASSAVSARVPAGDAVAPAAAEVPSAPDSAAEQLTVAQPIAPAADYLPKPVASETDSVFIPTFANPLPATKATGEVSPAVDVKSPATPALPLQIEQSTEEVPVATPAVILPEWQSVSSAQIELPSAEEAITAFEEANTVNNPMPNLVDDVILAVGGEAGDGLGRVGDVSQDLPIYAQVDASDSQAEDQSQNLGTAKAPGSGLGSLITTWNGTGNLLLLIAAGFIAGMLKFSLLTLLLGAFGALVVTGLGFGTAALTARRGRQPQATISRAVYGVRGAAVPLIFVTIARYAATAVAAIASVVAVRWYFPSIPNSLTVSGFSVDVFYPVLAGLMLLAALATALGSSARRVVTLVVAFASIAWIAAAIGLAAWLQPSVFSFGSLDSAKALALASALLILISVIWGTTAADETPNLRSNIHSIKLIGVGLLTNTVFGSAAVLAGYVYFNLNLAALKSPLMGVVLTIAVILALSHQIRRTADSFGGFGLIGTRWWVVVGSLLVIGTGVVFMHWLVAQDTLFTAVVSLLPVAGVPVIAWLASYGIDALLRRENYHEVSLLRDYGFYGKVRVVNLVGWVLATAVGLGFVSSSVPGFTWLGYLAKPLGFSSNGLDADMGVWIAFAIAALAPLATIGKIHDQEAEGRALEQRHRELLDITGEA